MLRLWTLSSYWKKSMLMSNESETCTGAIGWNGLLDRNLSVVFFVKRLHCKPQFVYNKHCV